MKRKVWAMLMAVMVVILAGCGAATGTEKAGGGQSPEAFIPLIEVYFETQQALMMKQAEGHSGDFAEVSQHSKELIETAEYEAWQKEVKTVAAFQLEKNTKSEPFVELQTALNAYSKIQTDYFEACAKAKDDVAYNEVNTQFETQLAETQAELGQIMETFEE